MYISFLELLGKFATNKVIRKQKLIFSEFKRPEIKNQNSRGMLLPNVLGEDFILPLVSSDGPGVLSFGEQNSNLCLHIHMAFSTFYLSPLLDETLALVY